MCASPRRHAFGQHFLTDARVIGKIVDRTIELTQEVRPSHLLEVGPGRGALTLPLLDWRATQAQPPQFTLCEMDRKLSQEWRDGDHPIRLIDQDFLKVPLHEWLPPAPGLLGVVSNLPYASGTAILTRLAEQVGRVAFMVLMFQREVADRIRAEASTKAWGSLSLWIQNRWDVHKVCDVSRYAFLPPPKVESEVVELRPRTVARIPLTVEHPEDWNTLLRLAFAHRRKMIRSSIPKGTVAQIAFQRSGLDGTKRAEALSWEEWGQWFNALIQERSRA